MSYRVKKRKKIFTQHLNNDYKLKMRLLPLLHTSNGCVWLVSLAVSKSKRQINDWMNRRHNKRTRLLDTFLTGKEGNKIQAESGVAIPAYQGTTDAWIKTQTKFNSKVYADMLAYAKINPYSKETDKWVTAEKEALLKAFTGEAKVSDACDEAAKKVNEVLATEK